MSLHVTIRAIALQAGVSKSSVSLALRRSPLQNADTGDRIRAVAESMGWKPNPVIATWMAQRRAGLPVEHGQQIVFLNLFPDLDYWRLRPSLTRFVVGVERRARTLGYAFEEIWAAAPGMSSRRIDQILRSRAVEGVVIGSAPAAHAHLSLAWEHYALAAQGMSLASPSLSRAAGDYSLAVYVAVREMRRLGYRRIGFLLQPAHDARSRAFWSGAFYKYQQHVAPRDRLPIFVGNSKQSAIFARWLKKHRPDAVFTLDVGFRTVLEKLGYGVPSDIGFACLDLHRGYEHLLPGCEQCAGYDLQVEFSGEAAVDLIVAQLHSNETGVPSHPRTLLTPGQWISGETLRKVGPVVPLRGIVRRTGLLGE